MRRVLTPRPQKLLLFVLLLTAGAIVNVAVAWGCMELTSVTGRFYEGDDWVEVEAVSDQIGQIHNAFPEFSFGAGSYRSSGTRRLGWKGVEVRFIPEGAVGGVIFGDDPFDYPSLFHVTGGLPTDSLQYFHKWTKRKQTQSGSLTLPTFLVPTYGESDVPISPIWPGFAINTVFYAAVLWVLFAGPGFVRRRLRARRGLCPACAYDLRGHGHAAGSTTCPECGKAVKAAPQ